MNLIPHDDLRSSPGFNFAPMIDFLFLMLSFFATLAISRATLQDTSIELAALKGQPGPAKSIEEIHISISAQGTYKWLTEFGEYPMEGTEAIQGELGRRYQMGALPENKSHTEVLLHIDRSAPWKAVAEAIFAVRELGFEARPVYEPL